MRLRAESSSYWWLSFADSSLPKGSQFLGACIVGPADDLARAAKLAWWVGINPGGEVMGKPIADETFVGIPVDWTARLLTRDECDELDEIMLAWNASIGFTPP